MPGGGGMRKIRVISELICTRSLLYLRVHRRTKSSKSILHIRAYIELNPRPSPEDLAAPKIPNSIPGKLRNSLKSWSWRGNFHEASRKATKKIPHTRRIPPNP